MNLFKNARITALETQISQLELGLKLDKVLLGEATLAVEREIKIRESVEDICRQQKARINQLELELYGAKTTISQLTLRIDDLTHPPRGKDGKFVERAS